MLEDLSQVDKNIPKDTMKVNDSAAPSAGVEFHFSV